MIVASHPRLQCCNQGSGPLDQPMPSWKCRGLGESPMITQWSSIPKKIRKQRLYIYILVNDVNHVAMLRFLLTLNSTRASWSTVVDSLISIHYPTLGATLQCLTVVLRVLSSAFSQTDSTTLIAVHLCKILLIQKQV